MMWLREIWVTVLFEVKTFIPEKGFGFIESALPSEGGVRSLSCNIWADRSCESDEGMFPVSRDLKLLLPVTRGCLLFEDRAVLGLAVRAKPQLRCFLVAKDCQ